LWELPLQNCLQAFAEPVTQLILIVLVGLSSVALIPHREPVLRAALLVTLEVTGAVAVAGYFCQVLGISCKNSPPALTFALATALLWASLVLLRLHFKFGDGPSLRHPTLLAAAVAFSLAVAVFVLEFSDVHFGTCA